MGSVCREREELVKFLSNSLLSSLIFPSSSKMNKIPSAGKFLLPCTKKLVKHLGIVLKDLGILPHGLFQTGFQVGHVPQALCTRALLSTQNPLDFLEKLLLDVWIAGEVVQSPQQAVGCLEQSRKKGEALLLQAQKEELAQNSKQRFWLGAALWNFDSLRGYEQSQLSCRIKNVGVSGQNAGISGQNPSALGPLRPLQDEVTSRCAAAQVVEGRGEWDDLHPWKISFIISSL